MGRVLSTEIRKGGRRNRCVVTVEDGTGLLQCVWFQGVQYISKRFQTGDRVALSGKVTFFQGPQLIHPEYDRISGADEKDPLHTGRIIPMYPSTDLLGRIGLDSRGFRRIVREALDRYGDRIGETLPAFILESKSLMGLGEAIRHAHFPEDWPRLEQAERRIKYEELFLLQLFLALQRKQRGLEQKGIAFLNVGDRTRTLIDRLPFTLTKAQKRVLREIREDMKSDRSMNRLLQGDVGSGKTIVAVVAMLIAVENGYQACLMAPTEILAEQHYLTLYHWLEELGVRIALLKGSQKAGSREEAVQGLESGDIHMAVGTHALIQETIAFRNIGLVVIDEQHRFGVAQRAALRQKGNAPDVLVMTATPIPRTLALTLYGDLDVSVLDELPSGRRPVRTFWRKEESRKAVYQFIREEVARGRQAYVVYPLVEESEKIDLAAATEGYQELSERIFPDLRVALLHGRMKSEDKETVMSDFKQGTVQILVCTTVVEVGVDVPNASVMLLEHAERFGLTQLHQLRGRIGRGEYDSTCILLSQAHLTEDAVSRLKTMTATTDGFSIAEADLKMRGPGELCGTRQHGMLKFKMADLVTDGPLLEEARKDAFSLVESDPFLEKNEHLRIRNLVRRRFSEKTGLLEVG